jgi:hypothetical protein
MDKLVCPIWKTVSGETIACTEKIKVMEENMKELQTMAQEAFEDAVLMGCNPAQIKNFLAEIMLQLETKF